MWGPVRGAAIGTQQEVMLNSTVYIDTIKTCDGAIVDWIEFYDKDSNLLGHLGSVYTDPCGVINTDKKVFLYFEGQVVTFTHNGQEIALCNLKLYYFSNL